MFDNMKKYLVFSVKSVFFFLKFFSNDEKNTKKKKIFKERKVEKLSFVKLTLSPSLDVMNLWLTFLMFCLPSELGILSLHLSLKHKILVSHL